MTGSAGHAPFRPALRRATFPQGKAWGWVTEKVTTLSDVTRLTERYTYRTVAGKPTTQVASHQIITDVRDITYSYSYDDNGNILTVTETFISPGAMQSVSTTTSYVYDSQNQLLRENNEAAGKTWTWTYDDAGNILSHKEYNYTTGTLGTALDTTAYTYGRTGWGDLLTAYDGVPITSDEIGNPLTVGVRSYTWKNGRQLATLSQNGTTWSYTYNADGLRIGRTNGTTTYQYIYADGQLVKQRIGTSTMSFAYDAAGTPMSVYYSGANYYYVTNLQGDVIAITNDAGAAVVSYTYDAWGKILSITGSMAETLGKYNPLRYRGYVYDRETELYYLQSRYYDPEMGRFISPDAFASTGQGFAGNNMFAYCNNNPVIRTDPTGRSSLLLFGFLAVCAAVGGFIGGLCSTPSGATVQENTKTNEPPKPDIKFPQELLDTGSKAPYATVPQSPPPELDLADYDSPSSTQKIGKPDTVVPSNAGGMPSSAPSSNTMTTGQRVTNILVGATIGVAVGGAIVVIGGAAFCITSGATAVVGILGISGKATVAWGMLAFDVFPILVAPFYGIEMEPLEWGS